MLIRAYISVLDWYMGDTVRNNDTLTLVFSDSGDQYAGLGDLGSSVFRPKNSDDTHTVRITYNWSMNILEKNRTETV